ncbi:MAG: hypothetical protein Q7R95_06180 [bacterium]|nr:hypothetical protein [bacterium]
MIPIEFPCYNVIMGKDQKQYKPLPAFYDSDEGVVTSCWSLDWRERLVILFGGKLYIRTLTFNKPLQPILPMVENPLEFNK